MECVWFAENRSKVAEETMNKYKIAQRYLLERKIVTLYRVTVLFLHISGRTILI